MSADKSSKYLDIFPSWLRTLGDDVGEVGGIVDRQPDEARRALLGALNYLFKSLDLIPDGIDDLGYLDDAFVLRIAAVHAVAEGGSGAMLTRLAKEAADIEDFLESDYIRLNDYVMAQRESTARGRNVSDLMTDSTLFGSFRGEIAAWAKQYTEPSFTKDVRTLTKLRAFLSAKLP